MKIVILRSDFHSKLFRMLQQASISPVNDLVLNRQKGSIWTNDGPLQWRIYATLGLNELMMIEYKYPNCLLHTYKQFLKLFTQKYEQVWYPYNVMTWKRFPHHWPFVRGIRLLFVGSQNKEYCGAFLFFVSTWTSWWISRRIANHFATPWLSCDVNATRSVVQGSLLLTWFSFNHG